MQANDRQVGGTHYKTNYEHWDLVAKIPLGYFEGNTTKYVCRWRKKEGVKDLEKALHYLDKLLESTSFTTHYSRKLMDEDIILEVRQFATANDLHEWEEEFVLFLCVYKGKGDLAYARKLLLREISLERSHTPEDGGHHADR